MMRRVHGARGALRRPVVPYPPPLLAAFLALLVGAPWATLAQAADSSGTDPSLGTRVGLIQGGNQPPNARSPDYSQGVGYGTMRGMDMDDDALFGRVLIDQLEQFHSGDANGELGEAEGWFGNDSNRAWLRTEGKRRSGTLEDADVEAFWIIKHGIR